MTSLSATLAFGLVALALYRTDGHYDPGSVGLVIAATLLCLGATCLRASTRIEQRATRALPFALGAVVAGNVAGLLARSPGIYLTDGVSLWPFRLGVAGALCLAASYYAPIASAPRLAAARVPLFVAIYAALGAWLILASPRPFIDVWSFQQRAADLLLHGQNPWAADYANIYTRDDFVGAALLSHGRVVSFPYPPLSLLLSIPGYLAGDVRWSLLAAVASTAAFLVAASRRLGLPRGHLGELGAVALLFHARSFFLLEQAWTEPFVALGAAGCVWALAGQRPAVQATALGVFLSVKQYGLLWLPALWRPARVSGRTVAGAFALSGAVALPFFIWNPQALWQGVVAFQFEQPFRPDSLSALAMFARLSGTTPWQGLGVVAAIAVALTCAMRASSNQMGLLAPTALSGAATYLTFFVLEKQAFFNYYWFVCALLAMAITTSAPVERVVR